MIHHLLSASCMPPPRHKFSHHRRAADTWRRWCWWCFVWRCSVLSVLGWRPQAVGTWMETQLQRVMAAKSWLFKKTGDHSWVNMMHSWHSITINHQFVLFILLWRVSKYSMWCRILPSTVLAWLLVRFLLMAIARSWPMPELCEHPQIRVGATIPKKRAGLRVQHEWINLHLGIDPKPTILEMGWVPIPTQVWPVVVNGMFDDVGMINCIQHLLVKTKNITNLRTKAVLSTSSGWNYLSNLLYHLSAGTGILTVIRISKPAGGAPPCS